MRHNNAFIMPSRINTPKNQINCLTNEIIQQL